MPKMKPVNSDLEISADQMRWYLATYFKKKKHKWQWRQRQISKFHSYSCCGEEDGKRVVLSTNRPFKSLWKSQDQAHGSGERLGGDTVLNTGPWRPLWESLRGTELGPRTCLTQHTTAPRQIPLANRNQCSAYRRLKSTAWSGLCAAERHPLCPRDTSSPAHFCYWHLKGGCVAAEDNFLHCPSGGPWPIWEIPGTQVQLSSIQSLSHVRLFATP